MSRLMCTACNSAFDEEESYFYYMEPHGELDSFAIERFAGQRCPECGADYDELVEVATCANCEDYFAPDTLIAGVLCERCYESVIKTRPDIVRQFLEPYKDEFAEFAAEYV